MSYLMGWVGTWIILRLITSVVSSTYFEYFCAAVWIQSDRYRAVDMQRNVTVGSKTFGLGFKKCPILLSYTDGMMNVVICLCMHLTYFVNKTFGVQWCSGGGTRGNAVPPNILLEERRYPTYQDMGER